MRFEIEVQLLVQIDHNRSWRSSVQEKSKQVRLLE